MIFYYEKSPYNYQIVEKRDIKISCLHSYLPNESYF